MGNMHLLKNKSLILTKKLKINGLHSVMW